MEETMSSWIVSLLLLLGGDAFKILIPVLEKRWPGITPVLELIKQLLNGGTPIQVIQDKLKELVKV
jgi:hypothetical protein